MKLSEIKLNLNNPRFVKDDDFKNLVKSLDKLPVMTELREVVLDENNVIIGGNQRYRAAKEAGWTDIPTKIFTREMAEKNNKLVKKKYPDFKEKTYEEYCQEIVIKDNLSNGNWDWDKLANEWDENLLKEWGMDLPTGWGEENTTPESNTPLKNDMHAIVIVAYEDVNDLDKLTSLYELDCVDITDDIKDQLSSQRKVYVFKK
jgi:hypothetical protein